MIGRFLLILAVLLPAQAGAVLINSGTDEIRGTWSFDFETGLEAGSVDPFRDIFWRQRTATDRRLAPRNGALLAALGTVDFAAVTEADLLGLAYGGAIVGPPGGTLLDIGDVFAVRTAEGNYAKALVVDYDDGGVQREFYDIHIQWELFSGTVVSEPTTLALMGVALVGLGIRRPRLQDRTNP